MLRQYFNQSVDTSSRAWSQDTRASGFIFQKYISQVKQCGYRHVSVVCAF
jgi:hypothetical protein